MKEYDIIGGVKGGKTNRINTGSFKWNKQPVFRIKLVKYEVQAPDGEQQISEKSWIWPFIGRIRQGIIVHAAHGDPFMIDNEDGQGYLKLANGGLWSQGHKPAIGNVVCELDWSECITCFKPDVYREAIELNLGVMNSTEREAADKLLRWLDEFEGKENCNSDGGMQVIFTNKQNGDIEPPIDAPKSTPQVMAPQKRIKPRYIKRHLKHEQYKNKQSGI